MPHLRTSLFAMALLLLGSAVGNAAQPDPMDANAEVPALHYRPVLGDYQPYREAKIGPWSRLNAEVAPGATPSESAAGQPSPEMPMPHAGHHLDHKE